MSKKLFLLETDEALNGQLVSYLDESKSTSKIFLI